MKIITLLIATGLMSLTSVTANAIDQYENSLVDIESRSISARVEASNHIRSIVERYQATTRGHNGNSVPEAYYEQMRVMHNQAQTQLEMLELMSQNIRQIQSALDPLATSTNFSKRISVVKREVSCSEFALKVTLDHGYEIDKAIALANHVLKECKAINDAVMK